MVMMRDGISLHTTIYEPVADGSSHPVLMVRTPYSCSPYGEGFRSDLKESFSVYALNKYIIVFQSVRGRYLSEGEYENVRPLPSLGTDGAADTCCTSGRVQTSGTAAKVPTDDATDTYDTVEWLLANTRNNGNVGVTGVSYPGYYATVAALCGHPAIKAVSPQAPILDWYKGDDVHHNGALMLLDTYYFGGSFFRPRGEPSTSMPKLKRAVEGSVYDWFLSRKTIPEITRTFPDSLPFWEQITLHPDYDAFWQERSLESRLKDVRPAVLVVGGTFDTDDCYGAVNTYRLIREQSPRTELYFAYGPWYHGGWRDASYSRLGGAQFAQGLYDYYIYNVEYPFFRHYLEGEGDAPAAVSVAVSGTDRWETYDCWPPRRMRQTAVYLREGGSLSTALPNERQSFTEYVSDPASPVPFLERPEKRDRAYMAADQGFAREREDVLSFVMDVTDTLKLEGPVGVRLFVRTSSTDADFIVKLIDVAPDGSSMLLRGDVFRGKYRRSLSAPVPMRPGKIEEISFTMNDIAHHILPGHTLEVQVQSTWFPLVDLNPQTFVGNIYQAGEEDFRKATVKILHQRAAASHLLLPVVD